MGVRPAGTGQKACALLVAWGASNVLFTGCYRSHGAGGELTDGATEGHDASFMGRDASALRDAGRGAGPMLEDAGAGPDDPTPEEQRTLCRSAWGIALPIANPEEAARRLPGRWAFCEAFVDAASIELTAGGRYRFVDAVGLTAARPGAAGVYAVQARTIELIGDDGVRRTVGAAFYADPRRLRITGGLNVSCIRTARF